MCDILNCPNVHSDGLWESLQAWAAKPVGGIRAQVLRVQASTDTHVPSVLAQNVIPAIHNPECALVVFRGNTTVLAEPRLTKWIERWLASDRLVWMAGQRAFAAGDVPRVLGRAIPDLYGLPGWAVFSGPVGMLGSIVRPYAVPGNTTSVQEVLLPHANLDTALPPLVRVTYGPPPSAKGASPSTTAWFWKAALQRPAARPFLASFLLNVILVVLLVVLACIQCK